MRTVAAAFLFAAVATPCLAGAWTQPAGGGQVIIKYEDVRAEDGFDPDGARVPLPAERRERFVSVFAEYGLSDRVTLRLRTDLQSGEDAFVDYEGRGPLEVGVNVRLHRGATTAAALYVGVSQGGEGRNAGYAAPGEGDRDAEVRLAVGRSFTALPGPLARASASGAFVETQVARRARDGLPDEARLDLTVGVRPDPDWLLLTQVYAGAADQDGPRWVNLEASAVRQFGPWRLQAGWRISLAGRETPAAQGPVIGLWRNF